MDTGAAAAVCAGCVLYKTRLFESITDSFPPFGWFSSFSLPSNMKLSSQPELRRSGVASREERELEQYGGWEKEKRRRRRRVRWYAATWGGNLTIYDRQQRARSLARPPSRLSCAAKIGVPLPPCELSENHCSTAGAYINISNNYKIVAWCCTAQNSTALTDWNDASTKERKKETTKAIDLSKRIKKILKNRKF